MTYQESIVGQVEQPLPQLSANFEIGLTVTKELLLIVLVCPAKSSSMEHLQDF